MNEIIEKIKSSPATRRAFLQRMGAAGLGLAAISLLDGCGGGSSGPLNSSGNNGSGGASSGSSGSFPLTTLLGQDLGSNDNIRVLNFALTLEHLEADLYRQALNQASGLPLNTPLASSPSGYTLSGTIGSGGLSAGAAAVGYKYLRQFAFVEDAHRDFLKTALGGAAVKKNAAGYNYIDPNTGSMPANDLKSILTAIYPLEETGVRAYLGAGPYMTDLSLLTAAVSIYSTEARHSAAIAFILGQNVGPMKMSGDQQVTATYPHENTFEYFLTPQAVASKVTPLVKS